jgi:hypothetical protein
MTGWKSIEPDTVLMQDRARHAYEQAQMSWFYGNLEGVVFWQTSQMDWSHFARCDIGLRAEDQLYA